MSHIAAAEPSATILPVDMRIHEKAADEASKAFGDTYKNMLLNAEPGYSVRVWGELDQAYIF